MPTPKFSVIVPTHNGADRIEKALASVREQTITDYELIIVCDACTDESAEIAEEYGRVIVTDAHRDGLARNAGIDAATGEWILFLDDDDWFIHEHCFEILTNAVSNITEDVLDFGFIWKWHGYKKPRRDEMFVMAWCRAWRRSFIGDNRFDDGDFESDKRFFQKMILNNPDVTVRYLDSPIYFYNYMRKGSMTWMEKQKTYLNLIVVHKDEPWKLGKPFFDMVQCQRCVDMDRVTVTIVQESGANTDLDWPTLLSGYDYNIQVIPASNEIIGTAAARNLAIEKSMSDWVMFCRWDDRLADVCSLSMMIDNFPTDECDLIWGKIVHERKWYTGSIYLNCEKGSDFSNTDMKMYRRQWLIDNNMRFNTRSPHYEYIFNSLILAMLDPWRIRMLTTDFYPYLVTFRDDAYIHTEEGYDRLRDSVFERECIIAQKNNDSGRDFQYRRSLAKAVCTEYYASYRPDKNEQKHTYRENLPEFVATFMDDLKAIPKADWDTIKEEAETEELNYIQNRYNELKQELYLKNDDIEFDKWLTDLYKLANEYQPDDSGQEVEVVTISDPEHVVIPEKEEKEPRVVVYCGTYDVYMNMVASLKSLLFNTPVDKVYFLIEDDTFPYELPDIVETINVKNQTWFPSDGPNFDNAWTYMCMVRAAFPQMFPQHKKILSLDIDIVINDDVSDLWDYDLDGYYLAGVPERQRQKSSADPIYINFGVVMMNLEKLRQDNISQQVIDALNTRKFGCPEQDAYNKYCAGHILDLPAEFNYTTYSHITGDAERQRIIHYAGQKFWRHYEMVKRYSDRKWADVMVQQEQIRGDRHG